MKESIEIMGYWWLPGNEDKKLPGTLSFSQSEGGYLEILGRFDDVKTLEIENYQIILGMTQKGHPITLYQCLYSGGLLPITSLGGAKYHIGFIFDGAHFRSEADIKFNELCGSYTDLDAWVDICGFSIEQDYDEEKLITNVRFVMPSAHYFKIEDNIEVGIGFSGYGPNLSAIQTEVVISQHAYLAIKSNMGDIVFESMFNLLNTFFDLFQIADQRISYPIDIIGFSRENTRERQGQEPISPIIKIYYTPIEPLVTQDLRLPQEMLFTFKDLDKGKIKSWFDSFEKYQTIIHLYRSLFYSSRLFIETKFLNIAQALETLHSILFGSKSLSDEEFQFQKEKVLETVPQELIEWVEGALNYSNFKSFKTRIVELLNNKSVLFLGLIDDIDSFAKKVRITRNNFVHQTKQKGAFKPGKELYDAIQRLTLLFEVYILGIIGFSDEKVQELIKAKKQTLITGWKHLRSG